MPKTRLEAFTDAVIAIIMTILVPVSYTHLDVYKRQGLS